MGEQDLTNGKNGTDDIVPIYSYELLNEIQRTYIDWKALGGLLTDDEGNVTKISLEALATRMNVNRRLFYDQTGHIPNLDDLVHQRRREMAGKTRLAKVYQIWYLSALRPGPEGYRDRQSYLANFDPEFRLPTQQVKHEAGNSWADLMRRHADRKLKARDVQEGEIVNDSPGQP